MSDKALGPEFRVGDKVIKHTGDYKWEGEVCSVFWTPDDNIRYVVAHPVNEGYVLHIYSAKNLKYS